MDAGPERSTRGARIESRLRAAFVPMVIEVEDDSARHAGHAGAAGTAGQTHYNVLLVSAVFEGVSRVERSRMVHAQLAPEFDGGLHALALSLRTPAEQARLDA
jgi:BolA protein